MATLAGFRALTARKQHIRELYGGLALFLVALTVFSATAQYLQIVRPAPTGTLRDLLWTLPLLYGALWAAQWNPSPVEGSGPQARRKALGELLVTNGTLCVSAFGHSVPGCATRSGMATASLFAAGHFHSLLCGALGDQPASRGQERE